MRVLYVSLTPLPYCSVPLRESEGLVLQLVYISSARGLISETTCDDILATSRRNNLRANLSGLLVAGQRRFLQALEGPTEDVRITYARIKADPRHYACVLLGERHIESRQFGEWSMGFAISASDAPAGASLVTIVEALVSPLKDADLRAQFTGFAELQSRSA